MDRYTVLVAWMPPHNQNGRIIHYTIYMKTMEVSRGQYTRQFRVKPSTASSSGLYGHNQNQKTNVFYAVQGLNEVNFLDVYHKLAGVPVFSSNVAVKSTNSITFSLEATIYILGDC